MDTWLELVPSFVDRMETPPSACVSVDVVLCGTHDQLPYCMGALSVLAEQEKRGQVAVQRMSACGSGAALALLYLLRKTDAFAKLDRSTPHTLVQSVAACLPAEDDGWLDGLQHKWWITQYEVDTCQPVVCSTYANKEAVLEALRRATCEMPADKTLSMTRPSLLTGHRVLCVQAATRAENVLEDLVQGMMEMVDHRGGCSYVDEWSSTQLCLWYLYYYLEVMVLLLVGWLFRQSWAQGWGVHHLYARWRMAKRRYMS